MARRVTNRDLLVPLFNEIPARRPAADWLRVLDEAGVPAGRIKTVEEVCTSAHLRARDMIVDLPHPAASTVTVMGVPIKLHATPDGAATAPPTLGQHTTQILTRLLRLKRSDIARLRKAGIV